MELSEEETRVLIDDQLREAGWEVNTPMLNYRYRKVLPDKSKAMAIAEWPCKRGPASKVGLTMHFSIKISSMG